MNSCGAQYILKDCTCLTDPLNFDSNMCGYVSKQSGFVYACDPGCCLGKCANKNPLTRVEARPSAGLDLPPGYGSNIPQSNEASNFPGASSFNTSRTPSYKVGEVVAIAGTPLALVLFLLPFLA